MNNTPDLIMAGLDTAIFFLCGDDRIKSGHDEKN